MNFLLNNYLKILPKVVKFYRDSSNEEVVADEEEERFNTFSSNNYWENEDIDEDFDIDALINWGGSNFEFIVKMCYIFNLQFLDQYSKLLSLFP